MLSHRSHGAPAGWLTQPPPKAGCVVPVTLLEATGVGPMSWAPPGAFAMAAASPLHLVAPMLLGQYRMPLRPTVAWTSGLAVGSVRTARLQFVEPARITSPMQWGPSAPQLARMAS